MRFAPPSLTASTGFVLAFGGSVQTAAFPTEVFRACLRAAQAKDAARHRPRKEQHNSNKWHPELLLLIFPWAKQT